eukprot:SAG25_NODE_44_length_19254_cov_246.998121_14_plen_482_part_00
MRVRDPRPHEHAPVLLLILERLFWLAVVFMLLTTVARLVIARLVFWPRVREDKRWWFVVYTAVYVVEPASGQQLLKRTLRDHEDGGLVYAIGQGYVQTERDAVAVRAANELVAGRAEVRTVLALVGSEDAPGFAIQLLFLLLYSTGLSYIWYLSTAGTVLHMTRQAMGAYSTWRRLPALERMAEGRDKTFDPGVEADDTAVTDFAKEYGTAVRVVSLARKFDSPGAGFSDASLHSLVCHCPNLRGVSLSSCKGVTAEVVVALATHCAQLQSIDLSYCFNVTAEAVVALATHCAQLQRVNLSGCSGVTAEAVVALATHCAQLQSVNLRFCSGVTAEAVVALATHCAQLQSVNLTRCSGVTAEAVVALATRCAQLQSVNLTRCSGVTAEALVALATRCAQLQSVTLSYCSGVTAEAVVALATRCAQLQSVNLSGCSGVTAEAVVALATHCVQLQSVDLISCENVTAEAVQEALAKRPSCQWVH